jgi:hypothetical protein
LHPEQGKGEWLLLNAKMSNISAISWLEQATFRKDNDDV